MCTGVLNMQYVSRVVLLSVGVLFVASCANAQCPPDATLQVARCMSVMGALGESSQEHMCRVAPGAVQCAQTVIDKCPNDPGVNQFLTAMNWNAFSQMVAGGCPGGPMTGGPMPGGPLPMGPGGPMPMGPGGPMPLEPEGPGEPMPMGSSNEGGADTCSGNYRSIVMTCQAAMENAGETPSCSDAEAVVSCVEPLYENCANRPEIRMLSSMITLDSLRQMRNKACAVAPVEPLTIAPEVVNPDEGPLTPEETGNGDNENGGTCTFDNPKRLFSTCQKRVVSRRTGEVSKTKGCKRVLSGLRCIIKLKKACPNIKKIREFSTIGQLKEMASEVLAECNS